MDLYYRDSLDCLESILSNPLFTDKIDFSPRCVYTTAERLVRVYSEWMTGRGAWEMQVRRTCYFLSQTLTYSLGVYTRWCNSPWNYFIIR